MVDLQDLAYFSLAMCFLSLWIRRSVWLWASFLAISLILAFQAGVAKPFSLVPIGTLILCHILMARSLQGIQRWIVFAISIIVSAALILHQIPGFCNWNVSGKFWINYDKPFIGLFVLTFALPLIRTRSDFFSVAIRTVPLTVLGIAFMAILATASGAVSLQLKWPDHLFLRTASNLIFVSIPEEAFYRGFVQEELFKKFGQGFKGHVGSVLITSLFFAFMHVGWSLNMGILAFVFLASTLYGAVYQYTRSIESSIFCHFALNMTHMVVFSYHAM
jgi:hypothetical protein